MYSDIWYPPEATEAHFFAQESSSTHRIWVYPGFDHSSHMRKRYQRLTFVRIQSILIESRTIRRDNIVIEGELDDGPWHCLGVLIFSISRLCSCKSIWINHCHCKTNHIIQPQKKNRCIVSKCRGVSTVGQFTQSDLLVDARLCFLVITHFHLGP